MLYIPKTSSSSPSLRFGFATAPTTPALAFLDLAPDTFYLTPPAQQASKPTAPFAKTIPETVDPAAFEQIKSFKLTKPVEPASPEIKTSPEDDKKESILSKRDQEIACHKGLMLTKGLTDPLMGLVMGVAAGVTGIWLVPLMLLDLAFGLGEAHIIGKAITAKKPWHRKLLSMASKLLPGKGYTPDEARNLSTHDREKSLVGMSALVTMATAAASFLLGNKIESKLKAAGKVNHMTPRQMIESGGFLKKSIGYVRQGIESVVTRLPGITWVRETLFRTQAARFLVAGALGGLVIGAIEGRLAEFFSGKFRKNEETKLALKYQ